MWASKLKKEGKSVDKEEVLRQQATKREENKVSGPPTTGRSQECIASAAEMDCITLADDYNMPLMAVLYRSTT